MGFVRGSLCQYLSWPGKWIDLALRNVQLEVRRALKEDKLARTACLPANLVQKTMKRNERREENTSFWGSGPRLSYLAEFRKTL